MFPEFNQLKKHLKKDFSGLPEVKLAVLGDSATQFLVQAIRGWGYEKRLNFNVFEADYDQIESQILSADSEFYASHPEFVLLFFSREKLEKKFAKATAGERLVFAKNFQKKLSLLLSTLKKRLPKARVLYFNHPELPDPVFGNFSQKTPASFGWQLRKINSTVLDLGAKRQNFFPIDLAAWSGFVGRSAAFDSKMYVGGDLIFSLDFAVVAAKNVVEIVAAISGRFKKCLILDLDNTTWGGIIGDDGLDKIQVGDLGIGKAFTELQLWAKQLKSRGIILCTCSKNTDSVAREPFEKHPEMVLRLDDIAVFVANWENKADNIRHIQSVLNIGFDSMVFLDDNAFERNLVRQELPEITVPELPDDPTEYVPFLRSLNLFETASYSAADKDRTGQYQQEAERLRSQASFGSIDEYLESLDMVGTFAAFDNFSVPRLAQLSQRSNQFNLRTVRYTDEDIRQFQHSKNHLTAQISLRDKFGDHGLISMIIGEVRGGEELFLDTWIMSCRVLKRGVESFTLNNLVAFCRSKNLKRLVGEYLPTAKNGLVKNHFENLGFQKVGDFWHLDVADFSEKPHFIQLQKS